LELIKISKKKVGYLSLRDYLFIKKKVKRDKITFFLSPKSLLSPFQAKIYTTYNKE